jgi:UDP-N-acetylglucosamine 2-epimerase (non-hydrolysing)
LDSLKKISGNAGRKRILSIFGTRPEAIKLAPVIKRLEEQSNLFESRVCVTGQHRKMLDQVLSIFSITPHHDLNIIKSDQSLFDVTTRVLLDVRGILIEEKPDWVLVQGDTTTTFAAGLAAFYERVRVGHIEAGLRTYNKYAPFPEEINRRITDILSDLYFTPTATSKYNLLREGICEKNIVVSGNTVIDALIWMAENLKARQVHIQELVDLDLNKQMILVTGHRREAFGEDFRIICHALLQIAELYPNINIIYPVHLNPNVQAPVSEILGHSPNIYLIPPQDYECFVWLMTKAYLILTDSGGIQEEAPALGKPVLVMRRVTERPEGIEAGCSRLTGIELKSIVEHTKILLENEREYQKMAQVKNPYGDGKAAGRIVEAIQNFDSHHFSVYK